MSGFLSNTDIAAMNGQLESTTLGGKDMSSLMKYPMWTRGEEGAPIPIGRFIPNRQEVPTSDTVIGKKFQPPAKLPGPFRFAAATPPGNTGPHEPVWRGWRPKRPRMIEGDLPVVMPFEQRGPYFEAWQPTDRWIRANAEKNATTPSYASDLANSIPNYQKYDYFDVQAPTDVRWLPAQDGYSGVLPKQKGKMMRNVSLHGLGNLAGPTASAPGFVVSEDYWFTFQLYELQGTGGELVAISDPRKATIQIRNEKTKKVYPILVTETPSWTGEPGSIQVKIKAPTQDKWAVDPFETKVSLPGYDNGEWSPSFMQTTNDQEVEEFFFRKIDPVDAPIGEEEETAGKPNILDRALDLLFQLGQRAGEGAIDRELGPKNGTTGGGTTPASGTTRSAGSQPLQYTDENGLPWVWIGVGTATAVAALFIVPRLMK